MTLWPITFLATFTLVSGRISESACWRNDCVQKGGGLQYCFYPSDQHDPARYPACRDPALKRLVDAHIGSASRDIPTIAYYELDTLKFVGGQLYNVADTQRNRRVAICQTGLVTGEKFFTSCRIAKKDNDFGSAEAHKGGCGRYHGHDERVLREGCCGLPRAACPPSQDSLWYKVTAGEWKEWAAIALVSVSTLITLLLRG